MQYRDRQRQKKEEGAKPDRELGQHGRGLRSEQIVGEATSKSRAKAFALGALHKNGQDHQ